MTIGFFNAMLPGPACRSYILTCSLLLIFVLSLSTPVLAHGDEDHSEPQPQTATDLSVEGGHDHILGDEELDIHGDAHHHDEEALGGHHHDHSDHGPDPFLLKSGFGRFLVWLGKFHPAVVHLPIALLLAAALAELLSLGYEPTFFRNAVRFCLWAGALGAVVAACLGWFYGGFHITDEKEFLTVHRWNGTAVAALALIALWLEERRVKAGYAHNGAVRTLLLLVALMAGVNGYLGGLMVYGPEQHEWPKMEAPHSHDE